MLLPLLLNNLLSESVTPPVEPPATPTFSAGVVRGLAEATIARDVPCLIRTVQQSRIASLLGDRDGPTIECWMEPHPLLQPGYVIVARGDRGPMRYVVLSVDRRPAPHDCRFQVAKLAVDEVAT